MSSVLSLASNEQPLIDQVGGKALALIKMSHEGMPIPSGFVLAVSFFEPWITALHATPEWQGVQRSNSDQLGENTKALQARCSGLRFSRQQRDELDGTLRSFQETYPGSFFAVRSSSPEEDLEGASFAGGYETTLGVTLDKIESAILHSFASSFNERVYLYKKEHGFQITQPRIAVILQRQIDAESAGVAFSLNPLNNCFDEAVINANYGLGESVVNGEADPDVFVVDKLSRKILDTHIGGKELCITLNSDGGTTRSARVRDTLPAVTPPQVLELTDLLVHIENYYHKPVDIEWAIANGKINLLQVRPVTTYLPLPDEMITAPGRRKNLYADSTLIEQGIQKPLSVLGTDFVGRVLQAMSGPMGGDVEGIDGVAFTAGGRYYMNLSQSLKMMGRKGALAPGSSGDESVLAILDSIDLDQYLPEKLPAKIKTSKLRSLLRMIPKMFTVMKAAARPEAFLRKYQKELPDHLRRFENVIDDRLSMHQQAVNLTTLLHFFFYDYGLPMVFASQIAKSRIKRIFKEDVGEVNEQLLSLGVSLPGNKTAEMGAMMFDLAASDTMNEHTSAETFLNQLEQRTLDPEFLRAWDDFVAEYGARCPREIDAATARPGESPEMLFHQLKNMSPSHDGPKDTAAIFEEARTKREDAYAILHKLAMQKGRRRARSLEKLYKTWVTLGGYRETPKHYVIKVVDMFRKRALRVADTFVAEGRLDGPGQIFDLTIEDIDNSLADASLDLRAIAAERVVLINKIKKSHLVARVIDSRGKIFYPPRKEAADGELAGIPISPGVVRGNVKVFHFADEKKLLPGEILVTRATDPGWTPLFINAGGIILEIGGALQHGAVVAREYGIPCVSGLENATGILTDGQLVEIDGSNGIIRLLRSRGDQMYDIKSRAASEITEIKDPETGRTVMRLTDSDCHDLRPYYDIPAWSPDGRYMMFSSVHVDDMAENRGGINNKGNVLLIDTQRFTLTWLAGDLEFSMHTGVTPMWAKDSKKIFCGSHAENMTKVIDIESGRVSVLEGICARQVSPDGRELVGSKGPDKIVIMDLSTKEKRTLVTAEDCVELDPLRDKSKFTSSGIANSKWSPDGAKMILKFATRSMHERVSKELFVMNTDGTCLKRIDAVSSPNSFHHHGWHPDGERLIYGGHDEDGNPRLFLIRIDGTGRELVSDEPLGGHPSISPDGTRIVTDNYEGKFGESILMIDIKTRKIEKLASLESGINESGNNKPKTHAHPGWNYDGSQIVYSSMVEGRSRIFMIQL